MSKSCLVLAAALALAAGCASTAPNYQTPIANVNAAGNLPGSLSVGRFELEKGRESELNSVQARGVAFSSPVNGSYADYIAQAAASDLKAAGKLDPSAPLALTGTVRKNDLSAAGINTNDAEITVEFRLKDASGTRYEKTLTAHDEWESAFLGGIAIPRAIQNWVGTVQALLRKLYEDADFARATAPK
jgi:hypothetical protein